MEEKYEIGDVVRPNKNWQIKTPGMYLECSPAAKSAAEIFGIEKCKKGVAYNVMGYVNPIPEKNLVMVCPKAERYDR